MTNYQGFCLCWEKKRATPTTASPPVWELGLIYSNTLELDWEKTRHAHTCVSFQNFHLCLSQCSTILFRNYWSCHSNQVKVAIMDSVSAVPLSLWTGDRQSFLRLMPVFPSAPKHGNYTSFYVPLVQACDSNSVPISAAVLLRITAWQRGVTMCMLSWKNMFGDNTRSCAIFHIRDGMMFIPVDIIPRVFFSFDILIKY